MSEIIRSVQKKDVVTSLLHIAFNLVVAFGSMGLVLMFPDTPWPAIALVVVSKYRIFAVKPRFWIPNLLSNLTDFIFCAGIVVLVWGAGQSAVETWSLVYQIVLTTLYAVWLIVLKPLTKPAPVLLQAGISQFVGLMALFSVASQIPAPLAVLICFGIGFSVARHVLMLHKEPQYTIIALMWAIIVAELGFISFHWTITYGMGLVKIPEIAVIITILSFVIEKFYSSFRRNDGRIKQSEVTLPAMFGTIFLLALLIFFSGLTNF
ncbi:MAG: hypothetical protein LBL08_02335 [Candidatus Nomurabacteria bacterium]|jgi:hypothetical protein|nr:hypothetical protein [Candidatus Nomurabacteria bacterium]